VPLARVKLDMPRPAPPEIRERNTGVNLRARATADAPRRLVRLRRRDGAVPGADVLALPANLGRHAPPPVQTPTFTAPPPASRRGLWWVLVGAFVLVLGGLIGHHVRPPERSLRFALQVVQAGAQRAWTAPLAGKGRLDAEVLDIESDRAAGVMLVHGLVHNGTDRAHAHLGLELRLEVGGVPIRRRVVACCDDLELAQAVNMPAQHPHLRGGAGQNTVRERDQQTFSVVFPGLEARHFDKAASATIRIRSTDGS
jgi:hypothetical protein